MENLGIDVKLLVAQVINFALFFFIFKKFLAKPFTEFLTSQEKKDKERERLMSEAQKVEEKAALREVELRKKIKKEEDILLKKAKDEAIRVKEELIVEAQKEADQIVAKARREITDEKGEMEQEVKKKVADMSLLMLTKAFEESLDSESRKKITNYILTNLDKRLIRNEN